MCDATDPESSSAVVCSYGRGGGRYDPEPGPFLKRDQSGCCRRHQYARMDGIITHPATQPYSCQPDLEMARAPDDMSPSVLLPSIWQGCGETALRQRVTLEELRG